MEIQKLLDFKEKLKEQRDYEKNDEMWNRITNAIAYIDTSIMELGEQIRDIEWNCKRILSGK